MIYFFIKVKYQHNSHSISSNLIFTHYFYYIFIIDYLQNTDFYVFYIFSRLNSLLLKPNQL